MKTAKLIVGYTLRLVENIDELINLVEIQPDGRIKDKDKIKADIDDKRKELLEHPDKLLGEPYFTTFNSVFIADPQFGRVGQWEYRIPGASPKKPQISEAIRSWVLNAYPNAWPFDTHPKHEGEEEKTIFVGFNPRMFLKIWGLECSLPYRWPKSPDGVMSVSLALPPSMWFSNSDHRDIEEAVMPTKDCPHVGWDIVFKARGIDPKGWKGPGKDAPEDVRIITELASQLGFLK